MAKDLELAGQVLDVIPGVMKLLRRELRAAAQSELSIPQHRVLAHLYGGYSTSAELAELQGVSLPAISKMIDGLAKQGFIRRSFKQGNRKQVFLKLTDKGRARYIKSKEMAQARLAVNLAELSLNDQATLEKGLKVLERLMENQRTKKA